LICSARTLVACIVCFRLRGKGGVELAVDFTQPFLKGDELALDAAGQKDREIGIEPQHVMHGPLSDFHGQHEFTRHDRMRRRGRREHGHRLDQRPGPVDRAGRLPVGRDLNRRSLQQEKGAMTGLPGAQKGLTRPEGPARTHIDDRLERACRHAGKQRQTRKQLDTAILQHHHYPATSIRPSTRRGRYIDASLASRQARHASSPLRQPTGRPRRRESPAEPDERETRSRERAAGPSPAGKPVTRLEQGTQTQR